MRWGKKKTNKGILLLASIIIISLISMSANAVDVDPETEFLVGNVTYTVNQTMNFSYVKVGYDYILFNNTNITIDSVNNISITLVYLNNDTANAAVGESIFIFYANTTGGIVWFNISGDIVSDNQYGVYVNSSPSYSPVSNSTGVLSFDRNIWSKYSFDIVNGSVGNAVQQLRVKYYCPGATFTVINIIPVLVGVAIIILIVGMSLDITDVKTSAVILISLLISIAVVLNVSVDITDSATHNTETLAVNNLTIDQVLTLNSGCSSPYINGVWGYNSIVGWRLISGDEYNVSGRTVTVYKEYLYI